MITSKRKLNTFCKALSEQDDCMKTLIKEYGFCTITPWKNDPLTQLIGSIVSQQLSVKAAGSIFSRVKKITTINDLISPRLILNLSQEELRSCGLSAAKTRYVTGIAEAVLNNDINLEELKNKNTDEVINSLVKLKGVGTWTAEMFSMFSLGHADILAVDDLGLKKGIQILINSKQLPDKKTMEKRAELWRPYRSIASWYLWRLVENN